MTRGLALLVLLGLGGCIGVTTGSSAPSDLQSPGSWVTLAALPTPRQEVAVAALGGRVYVIGGFGEGASPSATVEAYDPATDRWEARAPLPVPLHHAAAAVAGGRLFVMGGYTGGRFKWEVQAELYEYDPRANAWHSRAPMPTPRGGLGAAVLDGRIHAVGGSVRFALNVHEVYDPATDRWTPASRVPTPRDHLAAVALRGRIWAIGGRESFLGRQYADVEIYDPATDTWQPGPALPKGRGGLAAVTLDDRILVFGGEAPFRIFNATETYEVGADRWIAKAPMPTPRHGIGAAVIDGRVYLPGGATEPGFAVTGVHEAYAP